MTNRQVARRSDRYCRPPPAPPRPQTSSIHFGHPASLRQYGHSKSLKKLRLLAFTDGQACIVGNDRQVQARDLRSSEVCFPELGPVPLRPIEGTGQHGGTGQIGVDEGCLRELAGQNSPFCRDKPDRSAKLKLHVSKQALVSVDRLE